jgi:hypothetical protein
LATLNRNPPKGSRKRLHLRTDGSGMFVGEQRPAKGVPTGRVKDVTTGKNSQQKSYKNTDKFYAREKKG